jgi:hypothetical protein
VISNFLKDVGAGQQESGTVGNSSRGNDREILDYGYAEPDRFTPPVYGAGCSEVSKFNMFTSDCRMQSVLCTNMSTACIGPERLRIGEGTSGATISTPSMFDPAGRLRSKSLSVN